jgi:serine protease DegQ
MSALSTLSDDLGDAVAAAARSVAAVQGDRRHHASATIWRPGVLVTADHALEHDDSIEVIAPDGARGVASLKGRDATTDLAVLAVPESFGPPVAVASPSSARVGHVALAIARTGGDGPSASMGVLSALGGPWSTWRGGRVDRYIRADLSLYPGFSGGPLVDASGACLGINTSGLTRHFPLALPPETVDRVVSALLAGGRIARGYLGVALQSVRIPKGLAKSLALDRDGAAIVVAVEGGSPAERGGVTIGDVLLSVDDEAVTDVEDIHGLLGPDRVGKQVAVDIIRGGRKAQLSIVVGERSSDDE